MIVDAKAAASAAIVLVTSADLGPSTRDLLTLEGVVAGPKWLDNEELASIVDEVLSEHEAIAVEQDDYVSVRAIIELRRQIEPLFASSPWGRR